MSNVEVEVEINPHDATSDIPIKKKRGRKPKPKPENEEPQVPKKRGRKPKGGKIVENPLTKSKESEYVTENVILHLKCNSDDLSKESIQQQGIETFDEQNMSYQILDDIQSKEKILQEDRLPLSQQFASDKEEIEKFSMSLQEDTGRKIEEKMKDLQKSFYFNEVHTNHSACFWCTCDFNHTSIHIPKYKINEQYHVYGCYCTPECAVAYLMNENIDMSQKYERYQLLNYL